MLFGISQVLIKNDYQMGFQTKPKRLSSLQTQSHDVLNNPTTEWRSLSYWESQDISLPV